MPPHNVAALLHLVGFLTGAALYGLLATLVIRRRSQTDGDRLPIVTAILGLLWNVIGLAAFAIRDFAGREPDALLVATAYSALGFLPAVVVHSVLRSQSDARSRRWFVAGAYAMSATSAVLMFWSPTVALQTLTWSYMALTVPVFLLTRRRPGSPRGWSIVALAVFAISALHLSQGERAHESWIVELVGHHASIPLIFAILYQDFRFALADLFLRRGVALFALVAIASGLYIGVERPILIRHDFRTDPIAVGVSVILWVAIALLYPLIQRTAAWLIDHVVLRRADYDQLREEVAHRLNRAADAGEVMSVLISALRQPLGATTLRWSEGSAARFATETVLTIPTTEAPVYELIIGPLTGGRRLLSDDVRMLNDIALVAARRIDGIRLSNERAEQNKLTTEAELRALRAQVNPHFLFNALNTIGYLIQTSPARAHTTLMKLTSLLRGVLRTGSTTVTLGEEIDLVSAYLDIERARFEERLQIEVDVPERLRAIHVPPLVIQPLVENAIKHGIANSRAGGDVRVAARLENSRLLVTVRNTGATTTDLEIASGRRRGVGLTNLETRLHYYYGDGAQLTLTATPVDTRAEVTLPT